MNSDISDLILVARGEKKADMVVEGAKILDVFSGDFLEGKLAIYGNKIAGIGDYEGESVVKLNGGYLIPGFIDAHIHIESSMVAPPQFARGVLPFGTAAVFADPHEIANVMGLEGVELMLELSKDLPLSIFYLVPSCIPTTHMETSGAELGPDKIRELLSEPAIVGLAEMMNFPGVLFCMPDVLEKIVAARDKVVDGHAPGLSGKDLNAYIAAGVDSDHECATPEEALEKLQKGMFIMIRESTGARNLDDLLPVITKENYHRILFASDDLHAPELLGRGHIDYMVRRAIELGLDPIIAIRIATINAAERFRRQELGAIAPGKIASFFWTEDFRKPIPRKVWASGRLVAENGVIVGDSWDERSISTPPTMKPAPFSIDSFKISSKPGAKAHIIGIIHGQIVTEHILDYPKENSGFVVADTDRDILKIAIIERHKTTGNIGLGLIHGFGLKTGAIASSVAHDSHNIVVLGVNDGDMFIAAKTVADSGGGFVAVRDSKVLGTLPLPLAGLMSLESLSDVNKKLEEMKRLAFQLGSEVEDPYMLLGFMALPVIPKLKLTDKGLVDVEKFAIIELFNS